MYEQYFGFAHLPFRVTPDPRVFYANSFYKEAFATLRYGIEARKGFIVITGEVGTGKTTLLKMFMRSAGSAVHTAYVFNPKLSFGELLRFILTDLGLPASPGDNFACIKRLNDYLIGQYEAGRIVALLVDEAQNLSNELFEQLRLLSNLETDDDKLIQIVLMGQPELEQRLEQPELRQLKQRVTLRCRLSALKADEVRDYIEFRLQRAGYAGKELFDPTAVARITLYSAGIPRLINVICDNALLLAFAVSKKKVSAELIEEAARDLKLTAPAKGHGTHVPVSAPPARLQAARRPSPARQPRQTRPAIALSAALAIVTGGALVLYDSQARDYLSSLTGGGKEIELRVENLNPAKLMPEGMKRSKFLGEYNPVARFQSDPAEAMQEGSPFKAESSGRDNFQPAEPLPDSPTDVKNKVAPAQKSDKPPPSEATAARGTQRQRPERPAGGAAADNADAANAELAQAQPSAPQEEPAPNDAERIVKNEQSFFQGLFEVTQACLVFDRPQPEAAVITTLPSRSWVRVERKDGNYLFVSSLNDPGVRGYVALEDAAFERIGK